MVSWFRRCSGNKRTDRQTDGGYCITSLANAVGNKLTRYRFGQHLVKSCDIMFGTADSKKPGFHGAAIHPFASPANLMSLAAEFHKSVIAGPPPAAAAFPYPPGAHLAAAAAAAAAAAGPFAAFMPLAAHPGMMNLALPSNHLQQAGLRAAAAELHGTTRGGTDVTSSRDLA